MQDLTSLIEHIANNDCNHRVPGCCDKADVDWCKRFTRLEEEKTLTSVLPLTRNVANIDKA